jgi:hypothetical protein
MIFLASHIVCMRPCKTLGMGEWLLKPSYYFATSVSETKSTCSVLGFDIHFGTGNEVLVALILYSKFFLLDLNASSNRTYKLNIFRFTKRN